MLQIDQAALTGESLPVKKHSGDVAFSGSTVKQGEREALVYATGQNTFFGRAAALISSTHSVANLQRVMTHIGAVCLITIGVWCAIEVPVQFAHYHHDCKIGEGEHCLFRPHPSRPASRIYSMPTAMRALSHRAVGVTPSHAYKMLPGRADPLLLLPVVRSSTFNRALC